MGKDSNSSAYDTSGLEKAFNRSMAMQKEARDSNIELAQPFYDTGVESMGRLSDLLGLGGGSIESRQQVYNEFLPQFVNENEEVDYAGLDAAVEAELGE